MVLTIEESKMSLSELGKTVIPFGMHKNKTLHEVLNSDPLYLDHIFDYDLDQYDDDFKTKFEQFMKLDIVQREIEKAVF